MNKKLIRKMLTAAGGPIQLTPEELKYLEWSKMTPELKREYRNNRINAELQRGPNIKHFWEAFQTYIGNRDPENPNLNIGIVNATPGRATPQLILLSAKLMETINKYWKNLGKLKIRLGGNGKYASGILTKPGTAPTTFNGQNINYITSPKGGNVTHKFYTDQGSEYILTKDGFARRVKSSHANTGGADAGLHEWNKGATRFLDSDELGWSYQAWTDRTKPLGFSEKDGIISLVTKDNGKWRYVMRSELRPNAIKNGTIKDGIILSAYTTEPKIGKWMLEYGTNPTGEINWFHPGSQVAFIEGLKQGGKMNILEFLKNGSGIHIKEKNRGKFTSYCGGKVTDECIRKAKASGNPTLVKRATFAANARKWKHKEGGKAFVNGINILDSNPNAYKNVKKKYKMRSALQGTKMNFFLKANNFLNSDLGKGLSNSLINGIGNIVSSAKATKAQNEALDTLLKAHKAKTFVEKYNENLQNLTNKSPIVRQSNAWNLANSLVSSENDFEKEINRQKLINEEFAKQALADTWYTTASNIAGTAINALNKNGVPKTVSSPSYFDNYVNTKYKKFGTFNPDGSMNMLGGTFTIKGGYKPNQSQLFNYQPLKLNV